MKIKNFTNADDYEKVFRIPFWKNNQHSTRQCLEQILNNLKETLTDGNNIIEILKRLAPIMRQSTLERHFESFLEAMINEFTKKIDSTQKVSVDWKRSTDLVPSCKLSFQYGRNEKCDGCMKLFYFLQAKDLEKHFIVVNQSLRNCVKQVLTRHIVEAEGNLQTILGLWYRELDQHATKVSRYNSNRANKITLDNKVWCIKNIKHRMKFLLAEHKLIHKVPMPKISVS